VNRSVAHEPRKFIIIIIIIIIIISASIPLLPFLCCCRCWFQIDSNHHVFPLIFPELFPIGESRARAEE